MLVAPFDAAEGSGPGGRVREVYRLPGQLEAGPPWGSAARPCPLLTVCGCWRSIRGAASSPRHTPLAYSLTSVQLRDVAPQVGVSLRGVKWLTSYHSPLFFLVHAVR